MTVLEELIIHINDIGIREYPLATLEFIKELREKEQQQFQKNFDLRAFLINNRVLVLAVTKQWFDLMETGEKPLEFRKPTKFIKDRLFDKNGNTREYDYILINNGYGYHLPYFIAKYEGHGTGYNNHYIFSDGSEIRPAAEDYALFLGEILLKKNINNKKP